MIRDTFRDASMFYIEKKILLKISKFGKLNYALKKRTLMTQNDIFQFRFYLYYL